MRRVFRNIHGEIVSEIPYSLEVLRKRPEARVYVGSDSQKKKGYVHFALVIAFRYGKRGCHFIYSRWSEPRDQYKKGIESVDQRLIKEITVSLELANRLKENYVPVYQVDLDLNNDKEHSSNKYVSWGVGWAKAEGYKVAIKPDYQVATKAANQLVQ